MAIISSWVRRRKTLRLRRQRDVRTKAAQITPRTNLPPPVHSAATFEALFSPFVHGPPDFPCSYSTTLRRRIFLS